MFSYLRGLFFTTKRRVAENGMRHGYRVQLWKWEKGDHSYDEKRIVIVVPGTGYQGETS